MPSGTTVHAEGMLRVLMAWLGGDRQVCSMVRVPTPEEEDAKRPHREREHLVQERRRVENRIEALLFTQGIRGRPSLRSWERDVAELRTGDGRALPPLLRAELDRLQRRLVMLLQLIRDVEAERAAVLAAAADDATIQKITALQVHTRHRHELRHRAGARGALPLLRQPPSARQLRRHRADALPERRDGPLETGAHAIVLLDRAGWHTTDKLEIPKNLTLLPVPPASPELNAAENIWQYLRQTYLSNRVFDGYQAIVDACCQAWNALLGEARRITSIATRTWATISQ